VAAGGGGGGHSPWSMVHRASLPPMCVFVFVFWLLLLPRGRKSDESSQIETSPAKIWREEIQNIDSLNMAGRNSK
jgi:hypothetical protein